MIQEWTQDPIATAAVCGIGAGLMTLAKRAAMPNSELSALAGWTRWRHGLSGFFLGGGAGTGAALLLSEHLNANQRLGLCLLSAILLDLSTSRGLAFFLRFTLNRAGMKDWLEAQDDQQKPS